MSWEERVLLGINIEYLWRCMLLCQDKILSSYDQHTKNMISTKFNEYDKEKENFVDTIAKLKLEVVTLKKKIVDTTKEYEGMSLTVILI